MAPRQLPEDRASCSQDQRTSPLLGHSAGEWPRSQQEYAANQLASGELASNRTEDHELSMLALPPSFPGLLDLPALRPVGHKQRNAGYVYAPCLPRPPTYVNIRAPDTESDKSRRDNELKVELMTLESLSVPCWTQRAAGTHRASPPTEANFIELMEGYHEAVAKWIIARATSGKCEGSEFVFDLIESAIRKEATEILLTPVQASD